MHINAIDLRQLRYFVAVAEELHFGRAARRLNLSQPPLSLQIKALEDHLGVMLLRRTKRHVSLTAAGQHLLPEARRLLRDVERIAEQTREAKRGVTGVLRLGVNFSAPLHPLTGKLLRQFRQAYPQVGVELVLHERPNLLQLVDIRATDLDAALIWLDEGHKAADILRVSLAQDALHVVLPADHALVRKPKIAVKDLLDMPLIAPTRHAGTQLYDGIMRVFASCQSQPRIVYETMQMPLTLNMVAAGQGIALLPDFLRLQPVEGVVFRPLVMPRRLRVPVMTLNLIALQVNSNAVVDNFVQIARRLAKENKMVEASR